MPRKNKTPAADGLETVNLLPASEIGFSEEGWEDISNNGHITFGDANRTLYTAERLNQHVEFDNEEDQALLDAVIKKYGPTIYIDLEN